MGIPNMYPVPSRYDMLATVDPELYGLSPGPSSIYGLAGVVSSVFVTHRGDHK